MFALARLGRLSMLLAVASTFALSQGCAAEADDDGDEAVIGEDAITTSQSADRLIDVPFYFSVPKSSITTPLNRPQYPYPTVWNPSSEVADSGLRLIVINQGGQEPAKKKVARVDMAKRLARAGVLEDGDIALSFRPNLAGTMAYPHVQMGVTHASLVYTQNGEAFNIDSPLDGEYVGQFNTLHFSGGVSSSGARESGTDALQIVRPKNMTPERKASLQRWVGALKSNVGRINGQRSQVKFQKDYLTPIFAATGLTTKQTVTKLGQIILEQDKTTKLPMYCSEFAWHMLALSSCSEAEIRAAGEGGAACVDPLFEPMPLVSTTEGQIGLAEGPLQNILVAPPADRPALIGAVFATGNASGLSSGHRAVAEQVAPLMDGLAQYYGGKAQGAPAEALAGAAAQLNAGVGNVGNYSPTAFLANATLPDGVRALDYVATVVFVDGQADMDKARRLAQNPVP
ncbi:MAG: hypothetical protein KIS78_18075 [Labilithrix sp.]|nr:hypothetical protein [Labilithrix sp.]MCW5834312.1 hypothetical protein [Labilithrix sp.]